MKALSDVLGVSRSNLVEQAGRHSSGSPLASRRARTKSGDLALLPIIRRLVDERPTYGYRRITALLNRERRKDGLEPVNRKRVLRIMQANSLVLMRHTGQRPGRTHDGVVVALCSNVRWCSDHLELHCRNGDVARVLFVIDACDREIIAWSAITHGGVSGEMVRDLMVEAVERRFGQARTTHPIEWLSNNCSAYIARETAQIAMALGLRLAFTPVQSPESNGMAEAFVKTLKRDYARLHVISNAEIALALLPTWIDDYNVSRPHSGLSSLPKRVPSKG